MNAFLRRTPPSNRLLLYCSGPRGGEWESALPQDCLNRLLERVIAGSGAAAALQWEHSRQLGLSFLRDYWSEELALPESAYLREIGRPGKGMLELQVDLAKQTDLSEYGEDLIRILSGKPRLREIAVVAEPEELEPDLPTQNPVPPEAVVVVEEVSQPAQPVQSIVPEIEQMIDSVPLMDEVEVMEPGQRIATAPERRWQAETNDLFGIAGEVHPDDLVDHGMEIAREDLAWLNPGDAIISPRRGPCRIKRVEDDAQQVVAKDENTEMVVISFRELLSEFHFDDGA